MVCSGSLGLAHLVRHEELGPALSKHFPQMHTMFQTYPLTTKSHLGLDSLSLDSVAQQFSSTTATLESLE